MKKISVYLWAYITHITHHWPNNIHKKIIYIQLSTFIIKPIVFALSIKSILLFIFSFLSNGCPFFISEKQTSLTFSNWIFPRSENSIFKYSPPLFFLLYDIILNTIKFSNHSSNTYEKLLQHQHQLFYYWLSTTDFFKPVLPLGTPIYNFLLILFLNTNTIFPLLFSEKFLFAPLLFVNKHSHYKLINLQHSTLLLVVLLLVVLLSKLNQLLLSMLKSNSRWCWLYYLL